MANSEDPNAVNISLDFDALPQLGFGGVGLSRQQTDQAQQQKEQQQQETATNANVTAATDEQEDGLGDLADFSSLGGLSQFTRLTTDPVHQQNISDIEEKQQAAPLATATADIVDTFDEDDLGDIALPNISRLVTDAEDAENKVTNEEENESLNALELIPINKFCASSNVIGVLDKGIDTDFVHWNIWDLYDIADHYTLSICANHLFTKLALYDKLNVDRTKLLAFVSCIERGYLNVPYHSAIHAADVMINAFHLLIASQLVTSPLDQLCVLLAALCHDYKHPGVNEAFLNKTKHELASKYATCSMLEQMHYDEAMAVLHLKRYDFLTQLSVESVHAKYVQDSIRKMILATDMSKHSQHVTKLESMATQNKGNMSMDDDDDETHKLHVMSIGIHAADLASVCKTWSVFQIWALRIFREWFEQGDKEKSAGVAVSEFMDRDKDKTKEKITKRHSDFLTHVCFPLYQKWCTLFDGKLQFQAWRKQLMDNNEKLTKDGLNIDTL